MAKVGKSNWKNKRNAIKNVKDWKEKARRSNLPTTPPLIDIKYNNMKKLIVRQLVSLAHTCKDHLYSLDNPLLSSYTLQDTH